MSNGNAVLDEGTQVQPDASSALPNRQRYSNPKQKIDDAFPHATGEWQAMALTLMERNMIAFLNEITDLPDWQHKIHDPVTVATWRQERVKHQEYPQPHEKFSDAMFDYCMLELNDVALKYERTGFIAALDHRCIVYKSDGIISEPLRLALLSAATRLEDDPERLGDFSFDDYDNGKPALIDPALFCLIYDRTRMLTHGRVPLEGSAAYAGVGDVLAFDEFKHEYQQDMWPSVLYAEHDQRYHWLPSELDFMSDNKIRFTSVINNLEYPRHQPIYEAIENVLAQVIPMWNAVLTPIQNNIYHEPSRRPSRISVGYFSSSSKTNIVEYADSSPEQTRPPNEDFEDIVEVDDEWYTTTFGADGTLDHGPLKLNEPEAYRDRAEFVDKPEIPRIDLRRDYAAQGLQVVVHMAHVCLTPELPMVEAGLWDSSGLVDEHICASAAYYYDVENVTTTSMSFREPVDYSFLMEEGDIYHHTQYWLHRQWPAVQALFGIREAGPGVQEIGAVNTLQGRLLVWPNVLQSRSEPFELADPTRPGHLKFLTLHLVDPHYRIPSTAVVGPQRQHCPRSVVYGIPALTSRLPPEVLDIIVDMAEQEGLLDMEEAMEERDNAMSAFESSVEYAMEVLDSEYPHETWHRGE